MEAVAQFCSERLVMWQVAWSQNVQPGKAVMFTTGLHDGDFKTPAVFPCVVSSKICCILLVYSENCSCAFFFFFQSRMGFELHFGNGVCTKIWAACHDVLIKLKTPPPPPPQLMICKSYMGALVSYEGAPP